MKKQCVVKKALVCGLLVVFVGAGAISSSSKTVHDTNATTDIRCGDVNNDSVVNIGDIVYLISYLYRGGQAPHPQVCLGDVNGDGIVDIGDVVYLINRLYKGGPAPVPNCCG